MDGKSAHGALHLRDRPKVDRDARFRPGTGVTETMKPRAHGSGTPLRGATTVTMAVDTLMAVLTGCHVSDIAVLAETAICHRSERGRVHRRDQLESTVAVQEDLGGRDEDMIL